MAFCNNNPCLLPTVTAYEQCPVNYYNSLTEELDTIDLYFFHGYEEYLKLDPGMDKQLLNELEPFYRLFSEEQEYE